MAATAVALATALGAQPALAEAPEPVYFGNGCFWGRQYDFVKAEETVLGRKPGELSAVVGYAGGKLTSPSGRACYYYTPDKASVYERLGHAEVVQVELRGDTADEEAAQFGALADTYFSQFRRLPGGKMQRQDPQDAGPGEQRNAESGQCFAAVATALLGGFLGRAPFRRAAEIHRGVRRPG
jgi:hypothetical protein